MNFIPYLKASIKESKAHSGKGQSFVELAALLPVLLILLAGMIEIGAYGNDYMNTLDATREAARFGSNLDPELTSFFPFDMRPGNVPFPDVRLLSPTALREICDNGETTNFYYEVACLALQNMPVGAIDMNHGDDIVITVIGVQNGQITRRWPLQSHRNAGAAPPNGDWPYHFMGAGDWDGDQNASCTSTHMELCRCWSLYGVRSCSFDNATLNNRLRALSPATGYVIVEVYRAHPHFTGLFTIGDFIPDPIQMHPYVVFPLPAAEPRD